MKRYEWKTRTISNLIVCGDIAKPPNPPTPEVHQLPRLSDSNGSDPSPSLLKAMEAVVEAGRRGLLGPEAKVVATASKPNMNQGTTIGVVCQEASNHIPLVMGQEQKMKKRRRRRKGMQTAKKVQGSPIPVVTPFKGAKNPEATTKEIWICGNSLILTSMRRAKAYHQGLQLGVPATNAYVYWHGVQEMMWDDLVPLLHEMYQIRSCPCVIIIHLGENDLLPDNCTSLLIKIKNDLGILKRAFADTALVWSSLLPRRFWKEDQAPEVMENALQFVNSKMAKYCNDIGAYFLSHELITSDQSRLFLPGSNDLSDGGTDIFLSDLSMILKFLLDIKDRSYQSTSTWRMDF